MPAILRKFLVGSLLVLGLLILAAVAVAGLFEKEIGNKLIETVNASLTTSLEVDDFDLSLLSGFPDASATFQGVRILDTRGDTLLLAQDLSFRLGLFSLFRERKEVYSMVISDGLLKLRIDRKGKGNYSIFKQSDAAGEDSGDLKISLLQALFKRVLLSYDNRARNEQCALELEDALFSGEFSSEQFSLSSMAKLRSDHLDLGGTRYLVDKDIGYVADVFVQLSNGFYDIQRLDVAIGKNVFSFDGFIDRTIDGTDFDLVVTCPSGNIESVIQLLPEKHVRKLDDFRGKGNFLFDGTIKGRLNDRQNPSIDCYFSLKDGRISSPRLGQDMKDVTLEARFSNGAGKEAATSVFEIPSFTGYFMNERLDLELRVQDLTNPLVDFELNGALPLAPVYGLFDNIAITDGTGEVEIRDLHVHGMYADMTDPNRIRNVEAQGLLEFEDAGLTVNAEEVFLDRGQVLLNNNLISVRGLKLEGAGSDIELNGNAENLLPVLFADSLNSQNASLDFEVDLKATSMDFDRLVNLIELPEVKRNNVQEVRDSLQADHMRNQERIFRFLNGDFSAEIAAFNFNRIEGTDFHGNFGFEHGEVTILGEAKGMEGYFELDGMLYMTEEPYLKAKIECNEINIHDFFYQAENFGQEVIRTENVEGTLTARLSINAYWDSTGTFRSDRLHVLAGVSIEDGELINLEMLRSFSKVIHLKDLMHIRFVGMENWLEIRERVVYIPVMFLRSNALNLTVSGEHTFDQTIDYNFKINAGQVLMNLLRPHNPQLRPQESRKTGFFNLYYNLSGTVEDYKVSTSKRKVTVQFERSDRRRREVRARLEEQFGPIELLDEPEDWRDTGSNTWAPAVGDNPEEDEYIEGF